MIILNWNKDSNSLLVFLHRNIVVIKGRWVLTYLSWFDRLKHADIPIIPTLSPALLLWFIAISAKRNYTRNPHLLGLLLSRSESSGGRILEYVNVCNEYLLSDIIEELLARYKCFCAKNYSLDNIVYKKYKQYCSLKNRDVLYNTKWTKHNMKMHFVF